MEQQNSEQEQKRLMYEKFTRKLKQTLSDNAIVKNTRHMCGKSFTQEDVIRYLDNPAKFESLLRALSTKLLTISPQYQSILNYFTGLCNFHALAVPNMSAYSNSNLRRVKSEYNEGVNLIQKMNIQHEFTQIISHCLKEDVFYGIEVEDKNSYFIRRLDPDYCKIVGIVDGCFAFAFDFSYFLNVRVSDEAKGSMRSAGTIEDSMINAKVLESYPDEFKQKFNKYRENMLTNRWQQINHETSICIKWNETLPFVFPPFASLYNDIVDLQKYKDLGLANKEMEAYKLIALKIPMLNNSNKVDDFAVSPDTAYDFYAALIDNLPAGIGAFLTATEVKDLQFAGSTVGAKNDILEAENNIYSSSGIAGVNFGKSASVAGTVDISNKIDSDRLLKVYDQLERWLKKKFKIKFDKRVLVDLMKVTNYSVAKEREILLKEAQYGVAGSKIKLAELSGTTQVELEGYSFLENDLLQITETWKPLNSANVQSGNNEEGGEGRPEKEASELSTEGQKKRDSK